MTHAEYHSVTKVLLDRCFAIQTAKRREYTAEDADVLLNFKELGAYLRITPDVVWGVFFWKGIKSIVVLMREAFLGSPLKSAEPPIDRFADAINYLMLGFALFVEQRAGQPELAGAAAPAPPSGPSQPEQTSRPETGRPLPFQRRSPQADQFDPRKMPPLPLEGPDGHP